MTFLFLLGLFPVVAEPTAGDPTVVEPEKLMDQPSGQVILVEDLVTSILGSGARRQLRLRRCPSVIFRVGRDDLRLVAGHLRITGTTLKDGAQFYVDVSKVEQLPTDEQTFEQRSKKIGKDDFESWYSLGQWAKRRADLYENEQMRSRSEFAVQTGLEIQHRLAKGDPIKLENLRKRLASEKSRQEPDLDAMDHEILHARLAQSTPTTPEDFDAWARSITEKLIPEGEDGPKISDELIKRYDEEPIKTYRQASRRERLSLAAQWSYTLRVKSFRLTVERDSLSPFEAANLADARFPNEPVIAREWIERGVTDAEQRLLDLRRNEVETLVRHVRTRLNDDRRATNLQTRWLDHQLQQLERRAKGDSSRRDARAYIELASIHLEWMPSDVEARRKAARLLMDGLAIEPGLEPAKVRLKELGYRPSNDGQWLDAEDAEENTHDPSRSVKVGMTSEEVRKLLGAPDARHRTLTGIPGEEGVMHSQEQWQYRGAGATILILFDGERGVLRRVSSVNTLKQTD